MFAHGLSLVVEPRTAHQLDVQAIRRQFPIFRREINGQPLVYLDSASTAHKPSQVLDAMTGFYRTRNANVHRGLYVLSREATDAYEAARATVARFVNAPSTREVVFTRNTTEAINLVSASWGRANLGPGDAIVVTQMEHHSNLVPWQLVAECTGAELRYIPVTAEGRLDLDSLDRVLDERVKLVAVGHVSNALGTINPVADLVAAAHIVGARVLLDGAQSVPHMPIDVQELGVDWLAFSGHKMCGPTGIGVLWGHADILEDMPPYMGGGEMIRKVTLERSTWNDVPWKFEAGTPAVAEAVGLAVAIEFLNSLGMDAVHAHVTRLAHLAIARLGDIPGIRMYGPLSGPRGGALAFTLDGVHAHDVAAILDAHGVAVRAGHHCTMPLHDRLGVDATARASFYLYNSPEDVERLADAVRAVRSVFHASG